MLVFGKVCDLIARKRPVTTGGSGHMAVRDRWFLFFPGECPVSGMASGASRPIGDARRPHLLAAKLWDGRPHPKRHQRAKVEMLVTT
jgi:hypothetical protein